jgi:tetratricopeptide (TPR) repeat protein
LNLDLDAPEPMAGSPALGSVPAAPSVVPERASGSAAPVRAGKLDLGFSLEIEGEDAAPGAAPAAIPFPGARVASEGQTDAQPSEPLPSLAPLSPKAATRSGATRPAARRRGIPRWAILAAIGVVVLGGGAFAAISLLTAPPKADDVLRPLASNLARDSARGYSAAADLLVQATQSLGPEGDGLRARAAEILSLGAVIHGADGAQLSKADELLASIKTPAKDAAVLARAKALAASARGKNKDAQAELASHAAEPASQLVVALLRLSEDKAASAVDPARQYASAHPDDLAAHYVLGQALARTGKPEAKREFEIVLAKNPQHYGAALGLARLQEQPEKRLADLQTLLNRQQPDAGKRELALAQLAWGQEIQVLGRNNEALSAFQKAAGLDPRLTEAHLALTEAALYEGKYSEALTAVTAAGPALDATSAGRFAHGGALIAQGKLDDGSKLIAAAQADAPQDPRGPFWTGFAAARKDPSDLALAERSYREALKRDPKYLPASLKLAALLQQQNRAPESLTVLRAAEEAGAPPAVLQLAWGEALILAKDPVQAEAVFRKSLEADSRSASARLGVAAALEAQGKLQDAKSFLETTLKDMPGTSGLRERLAGLCLKLEQKEDALALYQEEIKAGHASPSLRLKLAKLAFDLRKFDLAQNETKKTLEESARNPEAAFTMARIYEARGEMGSALGEYRRALAWEKTPEYSLAYGRALAKVGKEQEAQVAFDSAISLAEGRVERGRLNFRHGDLDKALADFAEAAKLAPGMSEPFTLQGLCFDKMGQAAKAEEAWRTALRVSPDEAEPHYRLGRMEMDRGKPTIAIDHFRKAIARAPEKAIWGSEIHFQLAQAYLLTNSKANALAAFKKYLEVAPGDAPSRPEAERQVGLLGKSEGKLQLTQ